MMIILFVELYILDILGSQSMNKDAVLQSWPSGLARAWLD
jgi:hypothetical protein